MKTVRKELNNGYWEERTYDANGCVVSQRTGVNTQ